MSEMVVQILQLKVIILGLKVFGKVELSDVLDWRGKQRSFDHTYAWRCTLNSVCAIIDS